MAQLECYEFHGRSIFTIHRAHVLSSSYKMSQCQYLMHHLRKKNTVMQRSHCTHRQYIIIPIFIATIHFNQIAYYYVQIEQPRSTCFFVCKIEFSFLTLSYSLSFVFRSNGNLYVYIYTSFIYKIQVYKIIYIHIYED